MENGAPSQPPTTRSCISAILLCSAISASSSSSVSKESNRLRTHKLFVKGFHKNRLLFKVGNSIHLSILLPLNPFLVINTDPPINPLNSINLLCFILFIYTYNNNNTIDQKSETANNDDSNLLIALLFTGG